MVNILKILSYYEVFIFVKYWCVYVLNVFGFNLIVY